MGSNLTIANNLYNNLSFASNSKLISVLGDSSNITIRNETVIGGVIDDFYTIRSAFSLIIRDFYVFNTTNSNRITSGLSFMRIQKSLNYIGIYGFTFCDSNLTYSSTLQIDMA